jgi:tetratricopeptide (TPR) repeat protein
MDSVPLDYALPGEGIRLTRNSPAGIRLLLFFFAMSVLGPWPTVLVSQDEGQMTRGQHAQVEARLKQQLSADPRNGSLWFRLGVARAQLKETDPAIEAFQRAVALQTQTELAYFNLGLLYLEKNDGAKAVEAYKRGLALDPSNLPANQNLAFLLVQRGEFRDAIAPLERLKESSPTDVSARIGLAEAYLRAGLNEKGATEIDEILGSHLVTQPQGLALAKQLAAKRHPDLALRVLQSLTVDWPESANAHGELGLLLSEEGQFKNAAKELSRAVQLAPESERYSVGYGEALVNSISQPTRLSISVGDSRTRCAALFRCHFHPRSDYRANALIGKSAIPLGRSL